MKKKFLLVSVLFLALILVACGGQSAKDVKAEPEKNNVSAEEEKVLKAELQTGEIKASTIDELNELVPQEIDSRVVALNEKYEKLQTEIDTYDKYIANKEKMTDYYASVYNDMQDTCIRMREYGVKYAQIILESDKANDEKYDDLEEMYDVVYDDAGEDIYDEFYDGVLEDIYDVYYDGILDEAYDTVEYEEWSNARSEEYENWSDTRSDTYELWSDFRSEVYEFWSDLRSEFWDDDLDSAKDKIQDFQNDIVELKEEGGAKEKESEQPEKNSEANIEKEDSQSDKKKDNSEVDTEEMRPEFKEAMDSYEAFYDEYCEFMKKYNANPTDTELISSYGDIMTEMVEMTGKFEAWEENDLNTAELKYYIEVNNRVAQKLVDVTNE